MAKIPHIYEGVGPNTIEIFGNIFRTDKLTPDALEDLLEVIDEVHCALRNLEQWMTEHNQAAQPEH